jgi:hypothetical protein
VFRQTCRERGTISARAAPDPARLIKRVFATVTMSDNGMHDPPGHEVILSTLGETRRRPVRREANGRPGDVSEPGFDLRAGTLYHALRDIADGEGDVPAARRRARRKARVLLKKATPAKTSARDLEARWAFSLKEQQVVDWDHAWITALLASSRYDEKHNSHAG